MNLRVKLLRSSSVFAHLCCIFLIIFFILQKSTAQTATTDPAEGTRSMGHNELTGPIPKEIGNLKELYFLAFGSNNFTGSLPHELGNLAKLENFFMDSSGIGGEIPSTFGNLRSLKKMWAYDCPLTGKIPDFIGNWTKIESLQITDIYNGSSSIGFIRSMKNLTNLSLRNALISGNIPSNIGELQMLKTLDLSFNNLTGQVTSALFSIDTLTHLYLGNNSLSGSLPQQKSVNLQTMNLVGNNFTFDSSNISVIPGLNCLQRNFPCNKNDPRYSRLAIKCGGKQLRVGNIVYEADDGGASFNVLNSEKWAVSNVGLFSEGQFNTLPQNTGSEVINTTTPDLYQTARQSPGSLRYYGLGLENGVYNVSLFFAEIIYEDRTSRKWGSLGRRVFDVYIQAGGVRRAIRRSFDANVTDNHLEIHLFWTGKGTCCVPAAGSYGPLISALSVTPEFQPTVGLEQKKNQIGLIVGITVPLVILGISLIFVVFYLRMRKDKDDTEGKNPIEFNSNAWSLHESNQSLGLLDPTLTEFDENEALRVIAVALLCTQASPMLRPPMSRVVNMLTGDIEVGAVTSKPSYLSDWDFNDVTNTFTNDNIGTSSSSASYSKNKSDNPTDLSPGVKPLHSPLNISQFRDAISEGR
ncbi:hypothetical protein Pint_11542 [Pistacia integerrima]|uniref:Uncharacterized protein n=1 Tax=Pistacia integerrima TaxID=434235 RepID=A0ACC0XHQ1_9ROSI|nr:hypothetical protein Pint_11542 [Pistacia integerrima]